MVVAMTHSQRPDSMIVANRWSVVVLAIAFVVFGVAVVYAKNKIGQSRETYLLAKTQAANSQELTRKHIEDQSFLKQNETDFLSWHASGKIGSVDEVDWVELLLDARTTIGAEEFQHSLGDVESIDTMHGLAVHHIAIRKQAIKLAFEASHGAQVFQFFDEIEENAPGYYMTNELSIERIEVKIPKSSAQTSIDVMKLTDGTYSPHMHTISSTAADGLATSNPGISSVFGGVKVTAILNVFQFEMTD